jgi:hypothetical protein
LPYSDAREADTSTPAPGVAGDRVALPCPAPPCPALPRAGAADLATGRDHDAVALAADGVARHGARAGLENDRGRAGAASDDVPEHGPAGAGDADPGAARPGGDRVVRDVAPSTITPALLPASIALPWPASPRPRRSPAVEADPARARERGVLDDEARAVDVDRRAGGVLDRDAVEDLGVVARLGAAGRRQDAQGVRRPAAVDRRLACDQRERGDRGQPASQRGRVRASSDPLRPAGRRSIPAVRIQQAVGLVAPGGRQRILPFGRPLLGTS